eukprot:ANDGO_03377.mRNA.1 hypothetical protein
MLQSDDPVRRSLSLQPIRMGESSPPSNDAAKPSDNVTATPSSSVHFQDLPPPHVSSSSRKPPNLNVHVRVQSTFAGGSKQIAGKHGGLRSPLHSHSNQTRFFAGSLRSSGSLRSLFTHSDFDGSYNNNGSPQTGNFHSISNSSSIHSPQPLAAAGPTSSGVPLSSSSSSSSSTTATTAVTSAFGHRASPRTSVPVGYRGVYEQVMDLGEEWAPRPRGSEVFTEEAFWKELSSQSQSEVHAKQDMSRWMREVQARFRL